MKTLELISNNVYKIAVIALSLCYLSACRDNSITPFSDSEHKDQPIQRAEGEEKKIDWAMVAIADGGGAALGAQLAKYSGNIYAIIASAVGVGAYASYNEYERQKEDMDDDQEIIHNPNVINPYIPFVPHPIFKDSAYSINERNYRIIGEYHNNMVQILHEKYLDAQQKENEEMFFTSYNNAFNALGLEMNSIIDKNPDIYTLVKEHMAQSWAYEKDILLTRDPESLKILTTSPIEDVLKYINDCSENRTEEICEDLVLLSVAYYSECLWNTMAPNPAISQECIIWSSEEKEIRYISGRDQIMEIIENHSTHEHILYPAYDKNGMIALYLYTNSNQYGCSDYIEDLEVTSSLNEESVIYKSNIVIPKGSYKVEPTKCKDVYVIKF